MLDLSPAEWTAVELSLRIAIVATAWALPFGIAIGWLLARKNFWGKTLIDALVFLPLVLPPVVTGYLLLIWFGRRGPIGAFLYEYFGIVFSFRWTGAALACGIMGFPLMVRPIRLAFEAIDRRLEDAAATLVHASFIIRAGLDRQTLEKQFVTRQAASHVVREPWLNAAAAKAGVTRAAFTGAPVGAAPGAPA